MYKKLKKKVHNIIKPRNNDAGIWSVLFDVFIITLIIINIFLVLFETFNDFPKSIKNIINTIVFISIIIFTVEYLLRIWVSDLDRPDLKPFKARIKYIFSFMAFIDLAATLPFYLPINLDLRILRIFHLLRILKINRYTDALSTIGKVIKRKASQLISSILVVLIIMVIASVIMYNLEYEAQPEVFENAFSGLWWAINTLTTVGYGDIYPITTLGRILSAIISLLGIGLIALPTGIISAGFIENLNKEKEESQSKKNKHFCPNCGEKLD